MKRITIVAAICAVAASAAFGQGRKELRINEVMTQNETSIVDEYGRHSAWIEIVNPTHAPVDIAAVYLTDDLANPTKYFVPTGDASTKIGKGQSVVFYADGRPNDGTYHLNFNIRPDKDNFIAIFDADGLTLIDSVTVRGNALEADQSLARTPDAADLWQKRDNLSEALAVTPGASNVIAQPNNKVANFKRLDASGGALSVMGISIVFCALLVLCLCFYGIKLIMGRKAKGDVKGTADTTPAQPVQTADGEVAAAIAMALHQHLNMHDELSTALTIVHNPNSAWANKQASMRQLPRK